MDRNPRNNPHDVVEIWLHGKPAKLMLSMQSSHKLEPGEIISILKEKYVVLGSNWAIDYADKMWERTMRLAVTVERAKDPKPKRRKPSQPPA